MAPQLPVGCGIVTVVGQEVVVELPEDVQRYPAVGRQDVVVGLGEHGVEVVEGEVLREQLVGQLVDLE